VDKPKAAIVEGKKVTITFPFDRQIITDLKTIEGRRWDDKNYVWTVPFTPWHCTRVVEVLEPWGFWFSQDVLDACKQPAIAPVVELPDGIYPHQREGVEFIHAANGRIILADAMGTGKTITALAYVSGYCGRTLVVCPASVVYKWGAECEKWIPGWKVQLITTGKDEIEADADVLIMSYAIMVRKYRELETVPFDTVILDEAHAIKSYKSQRHRVAKALIRLRGQKVLFLSGTPFLNHPQELFPLLNILDPSGYGNFFTFAKRYLGAQYINGAWFFPPDVITNRDELANRLQGIMLRRTLSEVAPSLPELTRAYLPVELDNTAAYRTAVRDITKWLKEKGRDVLNPAHVLTRLNVLRQIVGEGKVKHAIELAENVLNDGRKVVLFAHHRDVVKSLGEGLRPHGVKLIVGDISQQERSSNINEFLMPDSSCRVMIISTAGAEGIDLYSASDIIFVEREWTPSREEQAEARLHRHGQKNPVTAHYLVAKGTVDEKLDGIIRSKRQIIGQVIKQDEIIQQVVMELLAY